MLASASIDFHLTDSYFVVAHFHYVLFGGSVFALFSGPYWFPKFTGDVCTKDGPNPVSGDVHRFHLTSRATRSRDARVAPKRRELHGVVGLRDAQPRSSAIGP